MARSLDTLLVIDVESTCWEGAPPADEESEIIEIGACLIDITTLERSARRTILMA